MRIKDLLSLCSYNKAKRQHQARLQGAQRETANQCLCSSPEQHCPSAAFSTEFRSSRQWSSPSKRWEALLVLTLLSHSFTDRLVTGQRPERTLGPGTNICSSSYFPTNMKLNRYIFCSEQLHTHVELTVVLVPYKDHLHALAILSFKSPPAFQQFLVVGLPGQTNSLYFFCPPVQPMHFKHCQSSIPHTSSQLSVFQQITLDPWVALSWTDNEAKPQQIMNPHAHELLT